MSHPQNQTSFIVVGAGIIGLSIALNLQAAGEQVLLLDKDEVGAGASLGNAGHIATEQVYPIADPSILKSLPSMLFDPLGPLRLDWRYLLPIMPWMLKLLGNMRSAPFERIHESLSLINAAALPAWQHFMDKWQLNDLVQINGSLLVAEKEQSILHLQKHGSTLNAIGVQNTYLNADKLHELEPNLASSQLGALFYPNTGHVVNLKTLLTRLTQHFVELGGRILTHTEVHSIQIKSPTQVEIQTNTGSLKANNVVIACGAYAKHLVKEVSGVTVPLETERGYHLMLPNETKRLSIPVSSADRRFIMTPMQEGLRLAGTVEYAGLHLPANMQRARNFVPLANPMLVHDLDTENSKEWMGFRPTIADSLPVIDRQGNCYFAFGHQHLGLTQAAITAEVIHALHFQQQPTIDCSAFSLNRFSS